MRTKVLVTVTALLVLLCIAGSVRAHLSADEPPTRNEASVANVVSPLLQYQGRLTDPITGKIVADDAYTMTFSLYGVASGDPPLWTETKGVGVKGGLFSTALGDTTSLDTGLFDGRALWLGIAVGTDAEATPRQQVLPVAYALSLVPGAVISDSSSEPVLNVVQTGDGTALYAAGGVTVTGDLEVGGRVSGSDQTTLPIAYGVVNDDGSLLSGSSNVSSAWNATDSRYEITISGHSYGWNDHVTTVTLYTGCHHAYAARTSSVVGKLLVFVLDAAGAGTQCDFQFVTYKP